MSVPYDDLKDELKNPEFVKGYGAEVAKNNIGMTLFKIRKRMNLTQKQLSDKLGISQPYIAKLESGDANPTVGSIGEILAILGFILITDTSPIKQETTIVPVPIVVNGEQGYACTYSGSFSAQPGTAAIIPQTAQLPKVQEKLCVASSQCYVRGGSV